MKNILDVAKSLPFVEYLKLVPLYWLFMYFFVLLNNLNLGFVLLFIPIGVVMYINILFYPWFRYYLGVNNITKKYFSPINFKEKIIGSVDVYKNTENRIFESYNVYTGYVYSKRESNDKLAESVFFFISHFLLFPFFRFLFLNIFGLFLFLFGWFIVLKVQKY